jgi:GGDEF domain-containing protein
MPPSLATAITLAVSQPVTIDQVVADVGASIGVAVGPEHGSDVAELMLRADAAMYVAKGVTLASSCTGPSTLARSWRRP